LSEAEARLAARLASGEALEIVTEQFRIAKETGVNSRVFFAKTPLSLCSPTLLMTI
jgi:hypothetical protein